MKTPAICSRNFIYTALQQLDGECKLRIVLLFLFRASALSAVLIVLPILLYSQDPHGVSLNYHNPQEDRPRSQETSILITPNAIGSKANTLDELVQSALDRNAKYLAAKERIAETQALMHQAGVRPTPTLEVEGSTGKLLGTEGEQEYSAGYFQPIETSGKRAKRIRVAEKDVDLARVELLDARRELVFEIKTRFAEAVAAQQKLAAINRQVDIDHDTYHLAVARVKEGEAAPLEEQLLLAEQNRFQAEQATYVGRSQSTALELSESVGFAVSDALQPAVDFELPKDAPTLPELQKSALHNRPDLLVFRILEEQATAQRDLARAEGHPDLTASARYQHRNSLFPELGLTPSRALVPLVDHDNILAFGVSIPLFTTKRTQGEIRAALSREAAARLRRNYLEVSIPLEVESAYRRWQAAKRFVAVFADGVLTQSERNLAVIREAYRVGQLRVMDVLSEQRRLIDSRLAYIDAQSEEAQAFAALEKVVGGTIQ